MRKFGTQRITFLVFVIVLVVVALIHSLVTNKTNLTKPDREKLVKMILNEVSHDDGSHRFLMISKYVCHTCFESALEKLGNDKESKKVTIILIGENDYKIKMMNAIYRKLDFKGINEVLYKKIEQMDVKFAEGAFIGVKKSDSGALSIYDGESEYDDVSARTAAVLDFILANTVEQADKKLKDKLNNLSTAGSENPSILARNSLVLRYPKRAVSINFSTYHIDTLNVGYVNLRFLRHMVDTTFEIATGKSFLLCERGLEHDKAFYDYSLYDIHGFPKTRKKLFRSSIYLNCAYNLENNVLLFHPTPHDANTHVHIQFGEIVLKEAFFDEYVVLLCYLDGSPRYNILKIERNQKSSQLLPYELSFDGSKIFGYAYDSTGIQLYGYQNENDFLKKVSEINHKLKTNFEVPWMTRKFSNRYAILSIEKFHNWVILYLLDTIGRKYIVSKFNIDSNSPVLKEFYSGDDMGGRFHNTNLFVYEDLQAKKLRIIEDVELK